MARPTRKTKNVDYVKFEKKLLRKEKQVKGMPQPKAKKKLLAVYKKHGA